MTLQPGVGALEKVHDYRQRSRRSNGTVTALPPDRELLKIVPTFHDFRALLKMARERMQAQGEDLKRKCVAED